jgi:hypothetical protein
VSLLPVKLTRDNGADDRIPIRRELGTSVSWLLSKYLGVFVCVCKYTMYIHMMTEIPIRRALGTSVSWLLSKYLDVFVCVCKYTVYLDIFECVCKL